MKFLLAIVAALVFAGIVHSECVEVTSGISTDGLTPHEASRNVRITVNLNGKPTAHASLTVSAVKGQLLFTVPLDPDGVGRLHNLNPGSYLITAMDPPFRSDLLLQIPTRPGRSVTTFSMNLVKSFGFLNVTSGGQQLFLTSVAKMPISERLRQFMGVVRDEAGSAVPSAEVDIFSDGTWEQVMVAGLRTDQSGHFSATLPTGIYRAIIHEPGFNPKPIVFQIKPDGEVKDLTVVLKVGSC